MLFEHGEEKSRQDRPGAYSRQAIDVHVLFRFYFKNTIIIRNQAMREWEDGDCGR